MATWRELGEVPDSEEEDGGFESQDTNRNLDFFADPELEAAALLESPPPAEPPKEYDVWAIPDSPRLLPRTPAPLRAPPQTSTSPPPPPPPQPPSPTSSPLTSLSQLSVIDDDLESPDGELDLLATGPEPNDTPRADPDPQQEPLAFTIDIASRPPSPSPETLTHDGSPRPPTSRTGRPPTPEIPETILAQELRDRQTAVRYQRSLRPRKPIQEHPYLLENAQYSNFMRSRGVKPVYIASAAAAPTPASRARHDSTEDSQEQEFQDDSQDTNMELNQEEDSQNTGSDIFGDTTHNMHLDSSENETTTTPLASHQFVMPSPHAREIQRHASSLDDENDDEDLPALADLITRPVTSLSNSAKRRSLLHLDRRGKRRKTLSTSRSPLETPVANTRDVYDLPSSSPSSREPAEPLNAPKLTSPKPVFIIPSSSPQKPPPVIRQASETESSESSQSEAEESEADTADLVIHKASRRMRGVLPASWLRLDQQASRQRVQSLARPLASVHDNNNNPRRGVAQRRIGTRGGGLQDMADLISSSSDDDTPRPPQVPHHTQLTLDEMHMSNQPVILDDAESPNGINISSDSDESAMEQDYIDPMLAGNARRSASLSWLLSAPKTSKVTRTKSQNNARTKRTRQPKITSLLTPSQPSTSRKRNPKPSRSSKPRNPPKRRRAPRLSILDVIEDETPQFLKIAARTARKRQDKGRASPSAKFISLADHRDNVDALATLARWRQGTIRPRPSVVEAPRAPRMSAPRAPFSETSSARLNVGRSQKLVKITTPRGKTVYSRVGGAAGPLQKTARNNHQDSRSTNLETDTQEQQVRRSNFQDGKRVLDVIFNRHRARGDMLPELLDYLEPDQSPWQRHRSKTHSVIPESVPSPPAIQKRRPRKPPKPLYVDIEAPQFIHTDDPVPIDLTSLPAPSVVTEKTSTNEGKLQGLGSYGTSYTCNFDVFPLDAGVFFHHSSLVGSGVISKANSSSFVSALNQPRSGRAHFTMDDKVLSWGPWDDQVASELGILLDWMLERIDRDDENSTVVDRALEFVVEYIFEALCFSDSTNQRSFLARILESFKGFHERLGTHRGSKSLKTIANASVRALVILFMSVKISRSSANCGGESIQLEDLLGAMARLLVDCLVGLGTSQVGESYDRMRNRPARERGLRPDKKDFALHSWFIAMRILEKSKIPRKGFWDVVSASVQSRERIASCTDASQLESVWRTLFTLLPMSEFDDMGIIRVSSRFAAPVEGWQLPQQLLKRVFELYRTNSQQSSSFNTYCRTLIARCHYLVQHWGWLKGGNIIGVVFDFFGSQSFCNLRNEETFRSPQFLENLASNPSLNVLPEDRCFHAFLKLLALIIQKLRQAEMIKDIRNLVTRTIPNHNRQYLKEQTIFERDLASLRNNHDLLCTLFWASPSELRPSPRIIEKLVAPGSSHKEACLINMRACSQLMRFLVSENANGNDLGPFLSWQTTVFQQTLVQYDSAASDIQQQYASLSKDDSRHIDDRMMEAMVKSNRAAAMDILNFAAKSSLAIIRHVATVETLIYSTNVWQLQQVLRRFSRLPLAMDWAILRTTLETLAEYLDRLDLPLPNTAAAAAFVEEAIFILDRDLAGNFFSMARCIAAAAADPTHDALPAIAMVDKAVCTELAFTLGARVTAKLCQVNVVRVPQLFEPSRRYALFSDGPAKMTLVEGKYLALFVASLVAEHGQAGELPMLEIWLLALVRPRRFLAYEYRLAAGLVQEKYAFVADLGPQQFEKHPTYVVNIQLFEYALTSMRRSLRDSDIAAKKTLTTEYGATMTMLMARLKSDLATLCHDLVEHPPYVAFVRDIISAMRSHAAEFCTIDEFFYQMNQEYSPSLQDPRLRIAGMVSYGLRVKEGETRVIPQLFYFLYNNFKVALVNDKLQEETQLLQQGMEDPGIFVFVVGRMLPAILRVTTQFEDAHPLLDVYGESLRHVLAADGAPQEVVGEDMEFVMQLYHCALWGVQLDVEGEDALLRSSRVHVLRQTIAILNALWPSLQAMSLATHNPACVEDLWLLIDTFGKFALSVARQFSTSIPFSSSSNSDIPLRYRSAARDTGDLAPLLQQVRDRHGDDRHVAGFADNMLTDVGKNWICSETGITVRAPGKGRGGVSGTQTGQGIRAARLVLEDEVQGLVTEAQRWIQCWRPDTGGGSGVSAIRNGDEDWEEFGEI